MASKVSHTFFLVELQFNPIQDAFPEQARPWEASLPRPLGSLIAITGHLIFSLGDVGRTSAHVNFLPLLLKGTVPLTSALPPLLLQQPTPNQGFRLIRSHPAPYWAAWGDDWEGLERAMDIPREEERTEAT